MSLMKIVQNSFNGGQLDSEMMGRQDMDRYHRGATTLRNFNLIKRGGVTKRQGFDRIMDLGLLDGLGDNKVRLIPYAWTKARGFVLVLSPNEMWVVRTDAQNTYKVYTVENGADVYGEGEVEALSYQQCGDVMFIAHPKHPPAKITHYIAGDGEHGFKYEVCEFNVRERGIPSITGAVLRKCTVARKTTPSSDYSGSSAGEKTEHYKVTAVFKDGETFPCEAYPKDDYVGSASDYSTNDKGGKDVGVVSTSSGTTYSLPWSDSQTIKLTVTPVMRISASGEIEYPEKILFYKKAFNYYGLIGSVDCNYKSTARTVTAPAFSSAAVATYRDQGQSAAVNVLKTDDELSAYGYGRGGKEMAADGAVQMTTANVQDKTFFVELKLGAAYLHMENTSKYEFRFRGNKATEVEFSFGGGKTVRKTLDVSADQTAVCEKTGSETSSQFNSRRAAEFKAFVAALTATEKVEFTLSDETSFGSVTMTPHGGNLVVNNVRMLTPALDENGKLSNKTFTDNYITPDASVTPPERSTPALFRGEGNYPSCVSLTQQRLVWASSEKDPARVWMSEVGDFYTYDNHEVQVDDDPIDFVMPITRFGKINHMVEMRKLLAFNAACEWVIDSSSGAMTYETIQAYPQSYSGSETRLPPVVCNNSLVFCERTGQSVRRFAYDLANDGFAGRDVSILSASIFENNRIVDWTYQQFPYSTLWCVLADGTMASFTYMEEQDIIAWATHECGGGGKVEAIATSHAISPAMDMLEESDEYDSATHEEVFAAVRRADGYWLERMRVRSKASDSVGHSLCLDGMRKVISSSAYDILSNKAGIKDDAENGMKWYNPVSMEEMTRAQAIAWIDAAEGRYVYEGYPFTATFRSVYPMTGRSVGTGQFDIKNNCNVGLRLLASYGGQVRAEGCNDPEPIRYTDLPTEEKTPEFDGEGNVVFHDCDAANVKPIGYNNRDGRIIVEQDEQWPFTMVMFELDLEVERGRYG